VFLSFAEILISTKHKLNHKTIHETDQATRFLLSIPMYTHILEISKIPGLIDLAKTTEKETEFLMFEIC